MMGALDFCMIGRVDSRDSVGTKIPKSQYYMNMVRTVATVT